MRVSEPWGLLAGHEPVLKKRYLGSSAWREGGSASSRRARAAETSPENSLVLAGPVSQGARSGILFYQMWFTEHHPDMCSTGPAECWLEHAAWLLSHDFASEDAFRSGISGYALRGYATSWRNGRRPDTRPPSNP
jgi:hypothetical protein